MNNHVQVMMSNHDDCTMIGLSRDRCVSRSGKVMLGTGKIAPPCMYGGSKTGMIR